MNAETWLIRTAQNEIRGPLSREQIQSEISSGTLFAEDEICRGDGYWFYLHESEELLAHLEMTLPKRGKKGAKGGDEEITETDTETETLVPGDERVTKASGSVKGNKGVKKKSTTPAQSSVRGSEELEQVSLLKMLAFVGVVLIVFLVAGAIRILWTS